ncbi:protein CEBPZOS-like [Rhopilema esculentum]|uniref:protein CEBPZOS-like n=1 Tax=Rhopilema esculentum TaxID=499914 RepID=UPI0031DAEB49
MASRTRLIVRTFVVAEVIFLVGSYKVWHQMNTNQDYRLWMHSNYPFVLEGFYKGGELMGIKDTKENDFKTWNIEK